MKDHCPATASRKYPERLTFYLKWSNHSRVHTTTVHEEVQEGSQDFF